MPGNSAVERDQQVQALLLAYLSDDDPRGGFSDSGGRSVRGVFVNPRGTSSSQADQLDALVRLRSMTRQAATFLGAAVASGLNVFVARGI